MSCANSGVGVAETGGGSTVSWAETISPAAAPRTVASTNVANVDLRMVCYAPSACTSCMGLMARPAQDFAIGVMKIIRVRKSNGFRNRRPGAEERIEYE
jgi:hypothetical protein